MFSKIWQKFLPNFFSILVLKIIFNPFPQILLKTYSKFYFLEKLIYKVSPFTGTDEICDLSDDQKVLLCRFFLINKPYELAIQETEFQSLQCTLNELTLINKFRCPFEIKNSDKETDKTLNYSISRGKDRTQAIIYEEDEDEFHLDGVVDQLIDVEQIKTMISVGLLSEEGKKYLSYIGNQDYATSKWRQYTDLLLHSDCKYQTLESANKTNDYGIA